MEGAVILTMAGLTSAGALLVGIKALRLSPSALLRAAGKTLEAIGLALVFFLGNLAAGLAAIFGTRALTGGFVSLYFASDESLVALSLLQALAFLWWRESPRSA